MQRRLVTLVATAVAVTVSVAACTTTTSGSAAGGQLGTSTVRPTPSTPPPRPPSSSSVVSSLPPPTPASTSSGAPATSSDTAPADVRRALLAPSDLGSGFTAEANDALDHDPLPCTPTEKGADDQIASVEHGGVNLTNTADQAVVGESLAVYGTLSDAESYQALTEAGLSCPGGTLSGETVHLSGPADLSSSVTAHVDKAEGWEIKTSSVHGALVLVRIHRVIVRFAFLAPTGHRPSIDSRQILETGVAKVINGH